MADFSELCPLFNTGVYHEVTFPLIDLNAITASGNALVGSLASSITMPGAFTFGRTVVITAAYARRTSANSVEVNLYLKRHTSQTAVGTIVGTCSVTPTISIQDNYNYRPFTLAASFTFASTDLLGLAPSLGAAGSMGTYDLIVRFRDK